ncbi:hypothetical protein DE4585_04534 [Mycobacteroides salmoniphilum]|uniref:Uncharacterized protein n=1 Tax=Mycobacteroides salmoniphilum TaxID=404941 RepID=A0A4R8RW78_9MYCO|nr:hypothetical protein DE4585_04534 [Mycobacteroides salmoniphilum]
MKGWGVQDNPEGLDFLVSRGVSAGNLGDRFPEINTGGRVPGEIEAGCELPSLFGIVVIGAIGVGNAFLRRVDSLDYSVRI